MRILQVVHELNAGGMETMLINYQSSLLKSGVYYDYLLFGEGDFYDSAVRKMGGRIYRTFKYYTKVRFFNKIFNKALRPFSVLRILRNNRYDIVEVHGSNFMVLHLLKFLQIKHVIVHGHSVDRVYMKTHPFFYPKRFKRETERLANHYFACSLQAAEDQFSSETIEKGSWTFVPNAIDTSKFAFNFSVREKMRNELGFGAEELVVGHVGRFHLQKNQKFLIEIFFQIHQEIQNSKLLLVGKEAEDYSIRDKVKEYKLEDSVVFTGVREDVSELMQAMDIFILPSLWEGLPLVSIEAQISGLPCVCSEAVPPEARITELMHIVSLKQGKEDWMKIMLSESVYKQIRNRRSYAEEIKNAGYDLETEAVKLAHVYHSFVKN